MCNKPAFFIQAKFQLVFEWNIFENVYIYIILQLWTDASGEAIDFVRSFLNVEPEKRMTPADGLKHAWMRNRSDEGRCVSNFLRNNYQN